MFYNHFTSEEMEVHKEHCDGKEGVRTVRWVPKSEDNSTSIYFQLKPFYEAIVKQKDELDNSDINADHAQMCVEAAVVRNTVNKLKRASQRILLFNRLRSTTDA